MWCAEFKVITLKQHGHCKILLKEKQTNKAGGGVDKEEEKKVQLSQV